jgi:hypothetical protein
MKTHGHNKVQQTRKYTPTWKLWKRNKCTGPTTTTLTTCELIQSQTQWYIIKNVNRSICTYIVLHTQCKQKTCSSLTYTSQAGAHNTPKPKPLSILPINTSTVISYNTVTMTFVTTFNCNTADNIYVKTCKPLGSQNGNSYLVTIYGSNHSLKMAHVCQDMSL